MKQRIKKILQMLGVGVLFAYSITLYSTFLMAYFHNYRILVAVNKFGEANIEFIIIPITLIWGLWALIGIFREI